MKKFKVGDIVFEVTGKYKGCCLLIIGFYFSSYSVKALNTFKKGSVEQTRNIVYRVNEDHLEKHAILINSKLAKLLFL